MTKKIFQFSQGETGPQGDQGPPGDIGQTGTPGPQGDPGEKGQTGETVSIKTVISIETKDQIESFEQLKHRHKQQGDPVRHQFFCQGTFQTKGATHECLSVFACIVLAHVHALLKISLAAVISHMRPSKIFSHFENCILVDVSQMYS